MRKIITIDSQITRQPQFQLYGIEGFSLCEGEHLAIVGENGAGKSIFVGILCGKYPLQDGAGVRYDFGEGASERVSENICEITFRDSTAASASASVDYFYQQRWNSCALDGLPTVGEMLESRVESQLRDRLFEAFRIEEIWTKKLVMLSSGEMRRFQICRAMLTAPRVLILDNPFIGLDKQTRAALASLLGELSSMNNLQLILVLSKTDEMPDFITHVVCFKQRSLQEKCSLSQWRTLSAAREENVLPEIIREMLKLRKREPRTQGEGIVELNNVSICYGERTILKDLNWTVRRGERWVLSGDNGAGKSTLLSLVCADNPQAYATDITLFGRRRGTGESIWDIKRNIGYISPEMQRGYMLPIAAVDIAASGLYDTVGVFRKVSEEQRSVCLFWLQVFGVEHLAERNFMQLSSGEQRLVLLARAFVKDPDLLILDEPLHGLDMRNRCRVREILELLSEDESRTMIIVSHYPEELPRCITHSLHLKRN